MKATIILIISLLIHIQTRGQNMNKDIYIPTNESTEWLEIPGLHHGGPITLTNQKIFLRVAGATALTYLLTKLVFKTQEEQDYWQVRKSFAVGEYKTVTKQHIGVERRIAPWFAVALEFSFQQWVDDRSYLDKADKFGLGIGLQPYFRWYILGKSRISPFLEYGTGFFQGFEKFPHNGNNYTFTHSSHVGVEYTSKKGNKLRLGYGQFHHSNNDWWKENPGYNANGFNLTYSWKMKSKSNDNNND